MSNLKEFYGIFSYESISSNTAVDMTFTNCIYNDEVYTEIVLNKGSIEIPEQFNIQFPDGTTISLGVINEYSQPDISNIHIKSSSQLEPN
jgi:hypothetical protein